VSYYLSSTFNVYYGEVPMDMNQILTGADDPSVTKFWLNIFYNHLRMDACQAMAAFHEKLGFTIFLSDESNGKDDTKVTIMWPDRGHKMEVFTSFLAKQAVEQYSNMFINQARKLIKGEAA
jgi:hypothetical protein